MYSHHNSYQVFHESLQQFMGSQFFCIEISYTPKILKNFQSNFYMNREELPNKFNHEVLKQFRSTWWLLWCSCTSLTIIVHQSLGAIALDEMEAC